MIVIAGLVLGALWGGILAWRRKGNALDIAQYAAGFGIMCAILGLIATIVINRMV